MSFYFDLVEGMKNMIGHNKKYANPTQMAKACGVAPNQIIRYINQERGKYIQVLAKVLDTIGAKIIFPTDDANNDMDKFHHVPKVLARPSGGGGSLQTDDTVEDTYAFKLDWLNKKGRPECMKLMAVTGESMAPRIEDGDHILVDESQKDLYEGRIYVVRIDQEIVVKRIAKEPGKILLMSDNPDAQPKRIEIDLKDQSLSWEPIGRVLYVSKDLR
ncbi:Phage repressor protein C, contains Cro/C1-type HTH and peptisase s24 domains [Maridesulfovibrio ferrireducens]|uniref:Phage repressor protein C, contains Cro/C1-type HTH and peptisase s24 domains n=1 Tax=Maridesulfovibrio ferrireducens TaxID=246191 RepID=A0A1G9KCH7_9BACT|nr:S24 family peptidase [Maridesulfovibrio ferrireducens]SDL47600.1 Phage repressor protein C, contains Cro/C1-type HTH and peptisase s24 domains [Maridesulfovibrio ferrireducens]